MAAGGIVALPGILILVAFGLKATGGLGRAASVAGKVPLPGAQAAAAGLQTAQGQAESTPALPVSRNRSRRDTQTRRPGEPFRFATPQPEAS